MPNSVTMRGAGELQVLAGEEGASASQPIAQRTVTRVDLAEAVYRRIGLSRKESALLVQSVLDEMARSLLAGEPVKLSSFGRFYVRAKSARVGRNPKTGIEVPITPRRVVVFKPSHVLKGRIDGLAMADEDDD